jgi:argininosuccinate lyase
VTDNQRQTQETWQSIARIVTAHVVMLRDTGIFDDAVLAALLTALDGVGQAHPPEVSSTPQALAAFDERLDAVTPPGAVGAAAVGRATSDVVATLTRLLVRQDLLDAGAALGSLRQALLALADEHVATHMPAFVGSQTTQSTTFGHFLGGLIGPLGRVGTRLAMLYAEVNRSPLGAGTMVSTAAPVDRERVAGLLGFDGLIVSTYDAVAAVDHFSALASWIGDLAAMVRRFLSEVLVWLRTEPDSFRLADEWLRAESGLPGVMFPVGIERLVVLAREVETRAQQLRLLANEAGYSPLVHVDAMLGVAHGAFDSLHTLLNRASDLLGGGFDVNRAYLANRAGRNHATSEDLAHLLIEEEGIEPAVARTITALTVRRAKAEGREASGITPEMIDAAALLTLGRDLGIEFEMVSRYLAPRRFVERRQATGGPAQSAARAYLDQERLRLQADQRWHDETVARLNGAAAELDRIVHGALSEVE